MRTNPIYAGLVLAVLTSPICGTLWAGNAFGVQETGYSDLSYFPKWTGMLARAQRGDIGTAQTKIIAQSCKPGVGPMCASERWQAFMDAPRTRQLRGLNLLRAVNKHINVSRYIQDPVNWGVPDFWAHLGEFFDRSGDCEDYAISKYATLKQLGFPTKAMRVLVLEDLNLDLAHAVLIVELAGVTYVLDNQVNAVLRDSAIYHYKPIYSINEHGWWMHRNTPPN
ncbi:MAG: transglutaminase-like cysteine peptidase [Pseudomonadota bacterium]